MFFRRGLSSSSSPGSTATFIICLITFDPFSDSTFVRISSCQLDEFDNQLGPFHHSRAPFVDGSPSAGNVCWVIFGWNIPNSISNELPVVTSPPRIQCSARLLSSHQYTCTKGNPWSSLRTLLTKLTAIFPETSSKRGIVRPCLAKRALQATNSW